MSTIGSGSATPAITRPRRLSLAVSIGLMACASAPLEAPGPVDAGRAGELAVHIEPRADLRRLDARICGAALSGRLIPGVPEAAGWATDLRPSTDGRSAGRPLTMRDGGVDLPPGARCLHYTVDLERAGERGSSPDVMRVSPGRWLWRPARLPAPDDLRATLTARLPDGMALSLPWPRMASGEAWHIPWNGFRYRSNAIFGRFERATLPVPGGVLEVAFVGEPSGDRARFESWLTTAAGDVATVFGRFPVPVTQVVVMFESGDDVGFGATARGGGPGLILYVGRDATAKTLAEDWTATHELFHLGMPLIAREDAWLSEGVTTVYTYLAMGRAGRLVRPEVFAELVAGFRRGALYGTGRTLRRDSATMHQTGAWWRVYWGGGAWALDRAIVMARGGQSFDQVLRLWTRANLDPGPARRADDLLRWADRVMPGFDLAAAADAMLGARAFPETGALLGALGVEPVGDSTRLAPEGAALRANLLAPAVPSAAAPPDARLSPAPPVR